MTILNIGSINVDHVYAVPHFPVPGETLTALGYDRGLGGKGANQSIAAARDGATVRHIGAVGEDGIWARDALAAHGVDITGVAISAAPTGHAMIEVDPSGENRIVILGGANLTLDPTVIEIAFDAARAGDLVLLQNETNLVAEAAGLARDRGLRVIYSAAPFDAKAVRAVLPSVDLLALNAVEAVMLAGELGCSAAELPVPAVLITDGAHGARYIAGGKTVRVDAFPVAALDTTGAGDAFVGCFVAALDAGLAIPQALRRAAAAAALQVTRPGAAAAMPTRAEIDAFLTEQEDAA